MQARQIFKGLLDGKKYRHAGWDEGEFVQLTSEGVLDENGGEVAIDFNDVEEWEEFDCE